MESHGHVLAVDDNAFNRLVYRKLLEPAGHRVSEVPGGEEALRFIADDPPDVIILDVMMPGANGYEICRRLKGDPQTAHIPVLMVTALQQREDRLQGIVAGANDFLGKPVDQSDLLLRVGNAIHAKHLFDQVQRQYQELRKLEALRDSLAHMIVHDLKAPLQSLVSDLEYFRLDAAPKLTDVELGPVDAVLDRIGWVSEMIDSVLDVNRIEAGQLPLAVRRERLDATIRDAMSSLGSLARRHRIECTSACDEPLAYDVDLIRRVLVNLLVNAIKYTAPASVIRVGVSRDGVWVRTTVEDAGPGIPPEFRARIFDKFSRVGSGQPSRLRSTGLGLAFCKLAVEAHGGRIGVEGNPGGGSTFWFALPADQPQVPAAG